MLNILKCDIVAHHQMPTLPNFSWINPCVSARDLVYIGLRDLDAAEQYVLDLP